MQVFLLCLRVSMSFLSFIHSSKPRSFAPCTLTRFNAMNLALSPSFLYQSHMPYSTRPAAAPTILLDNPTSPLTMCFGIPHQRQARTQDRTQVDLHPAYRNEPVIISRSPLHMVADRHAKIPMDRKQDRHHDTTYNHQDHETKKEHQPHTMQMSTADEVSQIRKYVPHHPKDRTPSKRGNRNAPPAPQIHKVHFDRPRQIIPQRRHMVRPWPEDGDADDEAAVRAVTVAAPQKPNPQGKHHRRNSPQGPDSTLNKGRGVLPAAAVEKKEYRTVPVATSLEPTILERKPNPRQTTPKTQSRKPSVAFYETGIPIQQQKNRHKIPISPASDNTHQQPLPPNLIQINPPLSSSPPTHRWAQAPHPHPIPSRRKDFLSDVKGHPRPGVVRDRVGSRKGGGLFWGNDSERVLRS